MKTENWINFNVKNSFPTTKQDHFNNLADYNERILKKTKEIEMSKSESREEALYTIEKDELMTERDKYYWKFTRQLIEYNNNTF